MKVIFGVNCYFVPQGSDERGIRFLERRVYEDCGEQDEKRSEREEGQAGECEEET
jgi:hypothetical protein